MKALYLDCFAGVSGNMLLGAFIQLGVPEKRLTAELGKLALDDEFTLNATTVNKHGISACYVDVDVDVDAHGGHQHHHRSFADIRGLIERSTLAESVKRRSVAIFRALAVAEGKVHGSPPDEVHFHEVGAIDSIVDIVGAAICLEHLGVGKVFASAVNVGSGTVRCAHGVMAVPAPATAELLLGRPTYHCGEGRELTTPTGAAFLRAMSEVAECVPREMTTSAIGYGAGTWDLPDKANVLRLILGECSANANESRPLFLLETNLDDSSGQDIGYAQERLREAGALDVWTTPISMKKNRPGVLLSVLATADRRTVCEDIMLTETTTLGVRCSAVSRVEAQRSTIAVATAYGEVRCKVGRHRGAIATESAEYDDCRELARQHGVPLKAVRAAALAALKEKVAHHE